MKPSSPTLAALFPEPRSLGHFDDRWVEMIRGARTIVVAGKRGECPLRAAAPIVGGPHLALALTRLLHAIGNAWPEPLYLHAPCCSRCSPDETLLVGMVSAMRQGDSAGFHDLLADLLPRDVRDQLAGACAEYAEFSRI